EDGDHRAGHRELFAGQLRTDVAGSEADNENQGDCRAQGNQRFAVAEEEWHRAMRQEHTLQRDRRNGNYFVWLQRGGSKSYFNLGPNKRKAGERLREIQQDVTTGKISFGHIETSQVVQCNGKKDIHIKELAVRHLESVSAKRALGTLKVRQHYVLQFLDFVGECMVSEVSCALLEKFHLWAKRKHSRGPNGGNEAIANIKAMLLWGQEAELCDLALRKFPKLIRTPPETKRIPYDDLAKLLATTDDDLRDMLWFGFMTGLRPKELMELKRSNFLTGGNGSPYIVIERHKTSRSSRTPRPRSVPLCPDAHAIVLRLLAKHPDSDIVFLNGCGTPYTRYSFKTRLARLCRRAKTSRVYTPYALRHTFASMESDAGVETTGLARLMGHTTTRTLERYVVNTAEHHLKGVTAVQDRIRSVIQQAAGDKMETKTTTETTTELSEAKRTHDAIVVSPSS
ncbi:MAG: site-specific integrase, partial [bacterium]